MADKLDDLFADLQSRGFAQDKTNADFRSYMLAPGKQGYENRKTFFEDFKSQGLTGLNSYEEFASLIGLKGRPQQPSVKPQMSAAGETAPVVQKSQPQAPTMPQLVKEGLEKGSYNSRPVPVRQAGDPGATQFGVPYKPDTQLTAAQRDEIYRQNDFALRQMKKMQREQVRRGQPMVDTGIPAANSSVIKTQGQWDEELQKGASRISSSVVVPAVDKAIAEFDKRAHEVFEASRGQSGGLPTGTAGGAGIFGAVRESNEAKDPDKILEYLSKQMEGLYQDKAFLKQIDDEAARMGLDSADYVENVIKPRIASDIRSRFDETMIARELPKSGKEYVVSGLSNSIIGMLTDAFLETKGQRAYKNQAEAMTEEGRNPYYNPGTGARLTKIGVSFAADAPFFGVYGKVSGQVAKNIAEREIRNLVGKGLSETAARSVVGTALENSVGTRMKNYLMQHIVSSSLTMGGYNATSEIARQTRDKEGYDVGGILGSTAEGLAVGGAFGATGAVTQALSQPLTGFARLGAKAAGFGVEAETMYATEELTKMLHGEDAFDNPFEGSVEAMEKLGVMKLSGGHLLKSAGDKIKRAREVGAMQTAEETLAGILGKTRTGVSLSDATKDYIRNTSEGSSLMESLSQMHPDRAVSEVNGKKQFTEEGEALRMQLARNYDAFMSNKDIPSTSKAELAQVFGGIYRPGLETGADIIQNEDGTVLVKTRDKDGNCIQDIRFDNLGDAEQWRESHQSQCQRNDAVNMWNAASPEARQEIVDAIREQVSGEKEIAAMLERAGGMRQNRMKRELEKVNETVSKFEGRALSDEKARNYIQMVIKDGDDAVFGEIYQLIHDKAYPADVPDMARHYWEGQQLSPMDRHFALVDAQVAEERLILQGQDYAEEVMSAADYPDEKIAELAASLSRGGITKEQFDAAVDYYNKTSKVSGMYDEAIRSVDNQVEAANAYVRQNTHTDSGSMISVTSAERPDAEYYLTAGHIEMGPDGAVRSTDGSGMVILRDKVSGEIIVTSPDQVRVDRIDDPNRIIAGNESMDGLRGQLMQQADAQIDLHPDAPEAPQEAGETFVGEDGKTYMVNPVPDENGNTVWTKVELELDENGNMIGIKGQPQELDINEYRKARSNEIDAAERPQEEMVAPVVEDDVEPVRESEPVAADNIPETPAGGEAGAEDGTGVYEPSAGVSSRIPTDEKGRKIYEQARPEDTLAELTEKYGEEKARQMIGTMAANVAAEYEKLSQKDVSKFTEMADLDAHEEALANVRTKMDYWNNLLKATEPAQELPKEEATAAEPQPAAEPPKEETPVAEMQPEEKVMEEQAMEVTEPVTESEAKTDIPVSEETQPALPTAEQKVAQGTIKQNVGKRFAFQNEDGTHSEVVIDAFKGDDQVEVTRQDYYASGAPRGEAYKQDLGMVDVGNSIINGTLQPVLSVEERLRSAYKGKPGMQNVIDVLTDEERRNMLSAVERGDQEALREMTNEYVESHREDIILNERDKRNAAVSRIMDGGGSREEKLRRVRKEYQGYDDAVIALSDEAMRPTTLEEYVSDLHSRQPKSGEGPLAYFSYDVDGNKIVGMQDESGHGTKTGGDTKGYAPWLAPKGKGMSLQRYAETVHEQLPEAVKEQYSDQDVRNAILSVFGGAERPSDITTMTLRRGILQAEQAARRMEEQWIDGPSYQKAVEGTSFAARLQRAVGDVNTEPTEGQKEAGNYKKGHMSFGGYDYTIENPAGSVRRGKDAAGREWEQKMNNTYGYILGKYGKDGDHLDMFINDGQDLDNWNGTVYVVDQVDPRTGKFDEHKVMYGFDTLDEAKRAYLSNYEEGWQGLGKIVGVTKEGFDKWLDSSKRKMKEFAEHSIAKEHMVESEHQGFDSALKQLNTRGISINDPELMKEYGLTDLTLSKTGDHVTLNKIVVENKGQGNGTRFMEDLARLADEKGWTLALTPSGSFGAKSISRLKDFYKRFDFKDNKGRNTDFSTRESMVRPPKDVLGADSPERQEQTLRDAVVEHLRSKGIDVSTDWKLGQKILDDYNGVGKLSASKKRAVETASLNPKEGSPADISTADGAKIQKKLESYANKLEKVSNLRKNFLEELAKELGATSDGSKSKYATFITKNGDKVTIRLGNHNATVSNFDYRGEDNGISIVVSRRENEGVKNNGIAHIVEAFYPEIALRKAYGKPLSEIVRSINEALNSGKYNDTTGLAEMEEVNADEIKQHKVYHGSGAEFDAFDHSHIGEGAGSQSFGYGTYVSAGQSVAEGYAHQPTYRIEKEKNQFIDASHAYGRALTALDDAKESGVAVAEATSNAEKAKKEYEEAKRIYEEAKKGYLYDVEIPGENEAYYIDYQGKMDYQKDLLDMVDNALTADGWKRQEIDSRTRFTKGDKQIILTPNQSGADLYAELEDALGSDKAASDFLYKTGITGMKYPAGTILGGGNGATNYVIFNESDAKITGRTKFFKTPDGHAYGYTYNGKIYVDPRIATTETPIHEYGHLWCEMKRETAPEEWKDFKQVMLNDKLVQPVIDKVKSEYPELTKEGREDDFVEEIITQFSGKRGNERLHEIAEEIAKEKGGIFGKAEAVAAMNRLKSILNRFWEGVAKMMGWKYTNANQIADRIMADMLNGLNLSESAKNGARYQLAGTKDATESEIMEAVSRDISPKEIEQAMNSGLVKQWLSSGKGVDSSKQSAFNLFGAGTDYLRAMAKARLGITNKYHVSNFIFNNAVEGLESLMSFAKEKGLDPAVADKYNFKDPETIKRMLDSDKPVYSDKEVEAILKVVPKAKEALEGMMQAFADENKILDEIDNLRNYDNGDAVTKAFAIFDIAERRLRDQYYGDERFYRPVTYTKKAGSDTWSTDTHYHPDYQPKEGEEVQTRYLLKSSVANDLLSRIATAPINDRKAGLPKFQKVSKDIHSENFKKFFGDWEKDPENASKVVDKDGKPLEVYHGTKWYGFNEFFTDYGMSWFSTEKDYSKKYTSLDGYSEEDIAEGNMKSGVYGAYLNIKNPIDLGKLDRDHGILDPEFDNIAKQLGMTSEEVRKACGFGEKQNDYVYELTRTKEFEDLIKSKGFDGATAIEGDGVKTYGVVEPTQIKSATDNIGEYNPSNPDIRFQKAPVFLSNAMMALDGIKQDKGTPEQWLKMIEKNGGLKAGEDKWIGLSDWLNEQQAAGKKSVTKQEIEDYIRKNQIQVEDVNYEPNADERLYEAETTLKYTLQDEFDYNVDEIREQRPDEIYMQDIYDEALERLRDRLGYTEETSPFEISGATISYKGYSEDNYRKKLRELASKLNMTSNVYIPEGEQIDDTRLSYTTNGLDNKREIALTVPTIEPYNDQDSIHFGDAGGGRAIAWIRFGDTTIEAPADGLDKNKYTAKPSKNGGFDVFRPNGSEWGRIGASSAEQAIEEAYQDDIIRNSSTKRILVIDEIQSKRHQDGREKGYKTRINAEQEKAYKDARAASKKAVGEMREYRRTLTEKYGNPADFTRPEDLFAPGDKGMERWMENFTEEERSKYERLQKKMEEATDVFMKLEDEVLANKQLIPEAPFEKNWHELAMKRMLRYAAENGYDKIAWTKGEQQAERYNIGNIVRTIDAGMDQEGQRAMLIHLNQGGTVDISYDDNGNITHMNNIGKDAGLGEAKNISEIVGKEIAAGALSVQGKGTEHMKSWKGDGLRIGAEGMKGFYDEILPRFMNKYGKKWGVKVEEVDLPKLQPSAQKMWSVDVTPDMKASVMKGQPMFQKVEDKTLMGVHNISEEKLKKALKLGGLANPSLAVIDTKNGIHTDYGEISLIPRSTLIDAKTGRNAGTYAGDAWTPTYPDVKRSLTKEGEKHINAIAKEASGDNDDMMRHIARSIENYIEGNGDHLHFLFLQQKGLNPEIKPQRTTHSHEEFEEIQKIFGDGTSTLPSYGRTAEQDKALLDLMTRGYEEEVRNQAQMISDESKREAAVKALMKHKISSLVDDEGNLLFAPADTFVNNVWRDEKKRNNPQPDWYSTDIAADNRVAREGLSEEYAKWKDQLLADEDIEERLFAGWTKDGYRRYLKNTVQNASRLMNKEAETNAYNNGGLSASKAGLVKKLKTLADIRKYRHLIKEGDDIGQELKEKESEWFDIIQQVSDMKKIDDNRFTNIDIAEARLQEAIKQRDPIRYLNSEYGYHIDKNSELASDLMNFIETASELPVKYFETKFKRPVGIEEFAIAVVPTTTSPEVVKALKDAGLEVHTYEKGATGDPHDEARTKAVMDAVRDRDDIMFQKAGDPEAEMTPEERQYWKQWDAAMKKWKERNAIPEDQTAAPEKPRYQQGETALEYAERLFQWTRQNKLWQTAPKLEDYRQVREDKDLVEDAREQELRYPDSPSARMRRAAAELLRIRHAVSRQKAYDKATVKAFTDFAQDFMKLGFGDNLGRGELERVLSSVKNATGAKDIKKAVDNIMNILIDNHLRNLDQRIVKLSSVKELSKTAQGVEKQGRLELKGQRMIQAFREAREQRMTEEQIRERMAEVAEKMNRNDEEAPMWEQEYEGLAIALQYAENIEGSRSEWADLDREYKDAVKGYKTSGRSYKDQQQLLESIEQAMQENKIDRIGYFGDIIGRLEGNISESMQGAKEFVERDKERVKHIYSLVNFDLAGKESRTARREDRMDRVLKNDMLQLAFSPLATFEQMLKQFGARNVKGEGNLYNYFMRNYIDSINNAYTGTVKAREELDAKAKEIFGDKVKHWKDLYEITSKPGMDISYLDGDKEVTDKLSQGNMLYIYMANKMSDGKMKLRKMGITEEDVDAIKEALDPRLVQLGDWLQSEYLPQKRTDYNKVHERMFGAPMAAIDNYFPIKVNRDAAFQDANKYVTSEEGDKLPSAITGSIIKRTRNALPLDILHTDALSLAMEHLEEMEQWKAQAEFNRDVKDLLSNTTFRNKVKNMKTIYGSGTPLWNKFFDAATIATGDYSPKRGIADKTITNIAKGVTAAKINFRPYTAFKQLLSLPAFFHDVNTGDMAKAMLPQNYFRNNFKWAMENIPVFKKRWESRQIGDTRLMDDPSDWKIWKNKWMHVIQRGGMWANAAIDALTCAAGAKAIYDTRYKKYKDIGASDEVARKRALQDAAIGYNLTQQSNEGAFTSAIQRDRTVAANALSVFRNSSMSYTRQAFDAMRNLNKMSQKGYKEDAIDAMTHQFEHDLALDEDQARKAAEMEYAKAGRHEVAKMLNMMFGVTALWNLGASLPYLIFGDDDETRKEMLTDALTKSIAAGPVEGLAGGNIWSDLIGRALSEETRKAFREGGIGSAFESGLKQAGDYEVNPLPLMADLQSMIKKMGYDKYAAAQDLFNIAAQSYTGVNPQTITDIWNAAMDYGNPSWMPFTDSSKGNDDLANPKEIALFIMRVLNAPTSSWRNKYIDELGMNAEDAKKLPYEEMAKRYANYKHWKDAPLMGWLRSDEARQKKMESIQKQFDKAVEERMQRLTDDELMRNVARSESAEEKRRYAKMIAQRLGVTPGDDSKKATSEKDWYQNLYQQKMSYEDIREDEILADKYKNLENYFKEKHEEAERKSVQDLKEFNEANKEWKDRIDEAKKEVKKRMDWIRGGKWSTPSGKKGNSKDATLQAPGKKQLETSDNPDEIMKNIRQWRKEALEMLVRAEK